MIGAYLIAFGALTKIRAVFFLFKAYHFSIPTGAYVFVWVLLQIVGMEEESLYGGSGISWGAHVGGFVAGVGTMLVFRRGVLRKMIRNKNGELQALDDEEREQYEKQQAARAERESMRGTPEHQTCTSCGAEVGPFIDNCPMRSAPMRGDEAEEGLTEEEAVPGPTGIRPWHVILGVSGVMLLAAAFVATRKDGDTPTTVILPTDKKPGDYQFKGKPLSSWIKDLKDENLVKRREATEKLRGIDAEGAEELAPLLAPGLKDEDDEVRQLSAIVLSSINLDAGQPEVVAALEGAFRDKDKNVRRYAATAFVQMRQGKVEKLAPVLKSALADADPDVQRLARYIHENVDPDGTTTAPLGVKVDLLSARQGFQTRRVENKDNEFTPSGAAARPPADIFKTVRYRAPAGENVAYVTPDLGDGVKRPAVLWAHGGFKGIGPYLWLARSRNNDQTASAFRAAGCVLMCPAWRNENDNPGKFSLFYNEVHDLLAARDYLAALPYVDPERIYLAGHDTGGTLTLLAATASDRFRAIFSFGGAPDMKKLLAAGAYGNTPFDATIPSEVRLRSATLFAVAIRRPTFYFGGEDNSFGQDAPHHAGSCQEGRTPLPGVHRQGRHPLRHPRPPHPPGGPQDPERQGRDLHHHLHRG